MLSGAVNALERLFVQQANEVMLRSTLLHNFHNQLIRVAGAVCAGINRSKLMLAGSDFIVLGFGEDAQTPKLLIQILHKYRNAGTDRTKVVVFQFLTLRGRRSEQCAARNAQIFALGI